MSEKVEFTPIKVDEDATLNPQEVNKSSDSAGHSCFRGWLLCKASGQARLRGTRKTSRQTGNWRFGIAAQGSSRWNLRRTNTRQSEVCISGCTITTLMLRNVLTMQQTSVASAEGNTSVLVS